jgi:hypothetical protein
VDAIAQSFANADRAAAVRVRVETELAAAMLREKTSYRAKMEYDPLRRYDDETPSCHRDKSDD